MPSSSNLFLSWISRDARLIIFARGLRTVGQSSVAVLLGIYLDLIGISLIQIGLFFSIGIAGGAFFSSMIVLFGNSFPRRYLLTVFTLLTGITGVALAFSENFIFLAVVAFCGSFSLAGGPGGPIQPLEQATLPETVSSSRRTDLFAVYNIVGTGAMAIGAVCASLPDVLQEYVGLSNMVSFKAIFLLYAFLLTIAAIFYMGLSSKIEPTIPQKERWTNPFKLPSRNRIFALTGFIAIDNFGTRMITQSLVALWFYSKFGIELSSIALIFGGSHLITATSLWLAARLANRFGLINTIVFSHIPAVLLLMAIPFSPSAGLAAAFWLIRGFFSQMDVPARQSYTMAIVGPNERLAMAGIDHLGRNMVGVASPSVAMLLWSGLWAGLPFIGCGLLKSIYLVGLYFTFRNVRTIEEQSGR